jgi:D-apionolactonase
MAGRAEKLFGTAEPAAKRRLLQAGPLSAIFEAGALRTVRYGDKEVIRMIAFLCRDKNWGTYAPVISGLKISAAEGRFLIRYDARAADAVQAIRFSIRIEGHADGSLDCRAQGMPESDFLTNRTGFVVLHPLNGTIGKKLRIEHDDGSMEETVFPERISPGQPVFAIRAMTHEVAPGLFATVRMGPDRFEMEDHRNWMDASFKTYVRSLLDPWPYILRKDEGFSQYVSLKAEGRLPAVKGKGKASAKPHSIRIGKSAGTMPQLAAGIPMEEAGSAELPVLIAQSGLRHLHAEIDGRGKSIAKAAKAYAGLKKTSGASMTLDLVLAGLERPASEETADIAAMLAKAGFAPDAVFVTQADDMTSYQPGTKRLPGPGYEDMAKAVRGSFPGLPVAGGMRAFFTELNRKPVPQGLFDIVTHRVSPIVHAADDASVMETLEAIPSIAASARALIGPDTPYHIGPSTIGVQTNPYGKAVTPNPENRRLCLAPNDPRHGALFGAAFAIGLYAGFLEGGAARIALSDVTGPRGLGGHGRVHPLFHVVRLLVAAEGAERLALSEMPPGMAAIAWRKAGVKTVLLANLTNEKQTVSLTGLGREARIIRLDSAHFEAGGKADFLDTAKPRKLAEIETLDSYSAGILIGSN